MTKDEINVTLFDEVARLRAENLEISSKLNAYREHSIQRGVTGSSCRLCFGSWAHSRSEGELHESWCPNKEASK